MIHQASRPRFSRPVRSAGLSLVEVLVALVVMATVAITYRSASKAQSGFVAVNQEFEYAAMLYLRQVERIRAQNLRGSQGNGPGQTPWNEPDFGAGRIPPFAYNDDGPEDLDLPPPQRVSARALLFSLNSFRIPDGHPWLVPLNDPAFDIPLDALRYSMNVRCARVQESPDPDVILSDRLVKFAIRIDRDRDGDGVAETNIITAEIFREVR